MAVAQELRLVAKVLHVEAQNAWFSIRLLDDLVILLLCGRDAGDREKQASSTGGHFRQVRLCVRGEPNFKRVVCHVLLDQIDGMLAWKVIFWLYLNDFEQVARFELRRKLDAAIH